LKILIRSIAILTGFIVGPRFALAGYMELSANGSYAKYNNGLVGGDPSFTKVTRGSVGLAYRFLTNTAIELTYTHSQTYDQFSQDSDELTEKYYVEKKTLQKILSINLILDFADKKATFRPFIRGGGGYMIRSSDLSAIGVDKTTEVSRNLTFTDQAPTYSASADAGIGFKVFIADSLALEFSGQVYATDLDKPEIYLHYAYSGGMRILF
jgi:hypothetical protein